MIVQRVCDVSSLMKGWIRYSGRNEIMCTSIMFFSFGVWLWRVHVFTFLEFGNLDYKYFLLCSLDASQSES